MNDYGMARAQREYEARTPPDDDADVHRAALQDEYDADAELERLHAARCSTMSGPEMSDEASCAIDDEYRAQVEARKEHLRTLYWRDLRHGRSEREREDN